jgi:hypothetical protein
MRSAYVILGVSISTRFETIREDGAKSALVSDKQNKFRNQLISAQKKANN